MAARKTERLFLLKPRSCRRLLPAQSCEPGVVIGESGEQRLDLAEFAAAVGRRLIKDAEGGFLIGDALRGLEISQLEIPLARKTIAILDSFREVIAGFEEQHRDVGPLLAQQVQQDHAFGLKAGSDARGARLGKHAGDERLGGGDHDSSGSPAGRPAAGKIACPTRPAAAVAFESRSINMKLPVMRFCAYGSMKSGLAAVIRTWPMSFMASPRSLATRARTVCVVCFSRYSRLGVKASPAKQTRVASNARTAWGESPAQIRSPRLMSLSSSRVRLTDRGACATSRSPSKVAMRRTRVRRFDGSTRTSSPGRIEPEAICPA